MATQTTDPPRGDLRTLTRAPTTAEPSIPRPAFRWTTRVIVPGVIVLTLILLLAWSAKDALWPAREVRVIPVVLRAGGAPTTGATANATGGVQAPGWVEADPYAVSVSALTDGIVEDVLALEGQPIKSGDVVATLIDDDAKLALAKADAEIAQQQATLQAAQRQWDNPVERTRAVAAGEAMVAEMQAELVKHHADLAVEEAKLASAKDTFERNQQSFAQKATSEIDLIRSKNELASQGAAADAVRAHEGVLKAQLVQREAELTAATKNLELRIEERKSLDEAKASLNLAGAARDEAALRLSRMQVRSPADGIVMQRLAEPGSKLMLLMNEPRSSQVVRLYNPKKLQVRVDVPLADAAKVGVGQEARVTVGVLPDRTFNGRITRIVNEADIQKNTLQVKVVIDDPSPQLKPEMLARVRLLAASENQSSTTMPTGAITVFAPEKLIDRGGGMTMVWVVNPRTNTAEFRMIELGQARHDEWIAVTSGLNAGDQLIADPKGLREGQKVRVVGEEVTRAAH